VGCRKKNVGIQEETTKTLFTMRQEKNVGWATTCLGPEISL